MILVSASCRLKELFLTLKKILKLWHEQGQVLHAVKSVDYINKITRSYKPLGLQKIAVGVSVNPSRIKPKKWKHLNFLFTMQSITV